MRVVIEGFDEALDGLLAGLEQEMPQGVTDAAKIVADEAAASHPYTNRTGTLQQRTVPGVTTGRFSDDTLEGEALGDTPYGGYVEEGTSRARAFPFLAPAAERREGDTVRAIEQGANRGARRAGWGT